MFSSQVKTKKGLCNFTNWNTKNALHKSVIVKVLSVDIVLVTYEVRNNSIYVVYYSHVSYKPPSLAVRFSYRYSGNVTGANIGIMKF